ncbi:hypothetical protein [Desulfotomaculum copahuensis]|uniref:Nif11 domain-containing protein n=1 Tax=Desulfotomaculum copahuensis TaxID=1838280 RepID=A0A1B7LFV8_9FIRM|nr:hypothetical protein [Desulfotomaculum copahuensis]OAT83608.1 hypothetical protein A6M21_07955 [Desulfotomaculum copahuensis]
MKTALEQLLERALSDAAFRRKLQEDAAGLLAEEGIPAEEAVLFLQLDLETLVSERERRYQRTARGA